MATLTNAPTRRDAAESSLLKLLNTTEAANALGVSRRTLQQLAAERKIAVIKFGRNTRFHPDALAAFAEAHTVKAAGWKGGAK